MQDYGFGQSLLRQEDERLLTGRGRFTGDIDLPRQAHGQVLRAPHAHAEIRAIEVAAAKRSPGVLAVLTGADAVAYNLGNFMRTLALPRPMGQWSLTTLREKLIKIGAKMVSHGRYVTFQMAEVAVSQRMFGQILARIARLRAQPAPA